MIEDLETAAQPAGLFVAGLVDTAPGTLVLFGASARFWDILNTAPEISAPDPVDRYSIRILTALGQTFAAAPVFPFGGPPYAPFLRWAMDSGRAWQSPVGMLVHDTAGLMISYRGALQFDTVLPRPPQSAPSPCDTCSSTPCRSACPVDALSQSQGYNVDACHQFLDTPKGADCLTQGCKARRACPVSARFGRDPAQSAYHMSIFHKPQDTPQ